MKKRFLALLKKIQHIGGIGFLIIFTMPASTHFQLKDYTFGGGGTDNSTSSNYALNGNISETGTDQGSSTNNKVGPGLIYDQQANVPVAPTFTNPASYYNKLHFVINTSGNASDTKFAIAISSDNFVTTNYIKSDNTVGATLTLADYQTYTTWGGAGGADVIGLATNTTFKIKVKAMQGKFTETGYGPTATAATVSPNLSFAINVAPTYTNTSPPFITNLGNLTAGSVITSTDKVWIDFDTNAGSGGRVYVYGKRAGLFSSHVNFTISSATADLSTATSGIGAQVASATQTSGGPFTSLSPYNGSSNNVGIVDTTIRDIFTASGPTTAGQGSFVLKAKSSAVTPAASDYSETLTAIAATNY